MVIIYPNSYIGLAETLNSSRIFFNVIYPNYFDESDLDDALVTQTNDE